jgi:type I restriction enzyme S subunit
VVKPASYYVDEGVPAIRGTNIKPHGLDLSDLVYFPPDASNGILKKSRISSGDVLAVRSGRPGLAAVVPDELDGANCIDVLIATTRRSSLLPEFLRDFLNSQDGRNLVLSNSRGQVQQHFNVRSLAEAEIPLPSIADQRLYLERITAIARQRHILSSYEANTADLFASLQDRAFKGEL